MATVRISGNWRSADRKELAGTFDLDAEGLIERPDNDVPDEVFDVVEKEMKRGGAEGTAFLANGGRIDWFVDR